MINNSVQTQRNYFIETLRLYNLNYRIFRYRIASANFSIYEKKLLDSYVAYKRNKKDQALDPIKGLKCNDHFLEAVRCYIIGLIYNQNAHYQFAIEYLEKSIVLLKEQKDQNLILDPLVLLALAYSNKHDQVQVAALLDQIKLYKPVTVFQKIQVLYIEVIYFEMCGQYTKAKSVIDKMYKKFSPQEIKAFKPFLVTLNFLMAFKKSDYKNCYKYLTEYKSFTGTNVRANFSYMKLLLDHLTKGDALYFYAKHFKDFPELYHQLEVIKSLSLGDSARMVKFWTILNKHNPQIYGNDFIYRGDYNLFSVCFKKYQDRANKIVLDQNQIDAIPKLIDRLEFVLSHTNAPLTKEELIYFLWKEEVNDANEVKLRSLLARLKKTKSVNVHCHHSTYILKSA